MTDVDIETLYSCKNFHNIFEGILDQCPTFNPKIPPITPLIWGNLT